MNLMRGLSLRQSLHTFGILWLPGYGQLLKLKSLPECPSTVQPKPSRLVSPETRYPCRVETHPVPKFDVFVSHTWKLGCACASVCVCLAFWGVAVSALIEEGFPVMMGDLSERLFEDSRKLNS